MGEGEKGDGGKEKIVVKRGRKERRGNGERKGKGRRKMEGMVREKEGGKTGVEGIKELRGGGGNCLFC